MSILPIVVMVNDQESTRRIKRHIYLEQLSGVINFEYTSEWDTLSATVSLLYLTFVTLGDRRQEN